MATETLAMPQLGESVTEGTIVRWLKGTGDHVDRDELLLEVETEKVSVEIPSPFQGVLQRILIAEGETVAVGTVLAEFETSRGETSSVETSGGDSQAQQTGEPVSAKGPSTATNRQYSPVVLLLAREHCIDLAEVQGTGDSGRVTRKDALEFVKLRHAKPTNTEVNEVMSFREDETGPTPPPASVIDDEEVPQTSVSDQSSAAEFTATAQSIPQAWMMVEVDVTELVRRCEEVRASVRQREGFELTHLPFVIKSVVAAVKKFPMLNSSWSDAGIIVHRDINIGVAVATDGGLQAPVIHGADGKSVMGIARELAELSTRAREGRLHADDLPGATFTIGNTGSIGSVLSAPLISPPQVVSLTCESVIGRPVVLNDAIAIRHMMNVCISFDHRVLDGAEIGRFMQTVKLGLQSFGSDTGLY